MRKKVVVGYFTALFQELSLGNGKNLRIACLLTEIMAEDVANTKQR
jgi:hypothetical protein